MCWMPSFTAVPYEKRGIECPFTTNAVILVFSQLILLKRNPNKGM